MLFSDKYSSFAPSKSCSVCPIFTLHSWESNGRRAKHGRNHLFITPSHCQGLGTQTKFTSSIWKQYHTTGNSITDYLIMKKRTMLKDLKGSPPSQENYRKTRSLAISIMYAACLAKIFINSSSNFLFELSTQWYLRKHKPLEERSKLWVSLTVACRCESCCMVLLWIFLSVQTHLCEHQ